MGEAATRKNILKALSDVFRKSTEPHPDLVIFYFSGQGLRDGYGTTYIAPYDIDLEDPFIGGIQVDDLRMYVDKFYELNSNTGIIVILDCDYSGSILEAWK